MRSDKPYMECSMSCLPLLCEGPDSRWTLRPMPLPAMRKGLRGCIVAMVVHIKWLCEQTLSETWGIQIEGGMLTYHADLGPR